MISIIIPVYNVERYLPKCIESVINQSYSNLECILIDDGSCDSSGYICDLYAKSDNRINVIHKSNGGLSSARNAGLEMASGSYVMFIDSDDFIDQHMVSVLYDLLKQNQADMSMCSLSYCDENGVDYEYTESPVLNEKLNRQAIIDKLFEPRNWFYVVACNKLYRKSIWENLRFREGIIHEDEAIAHHIFMNVDTVVSTSKQMYHYRQRKGSITGIGFNEASLDKYFAFSDRMKSLYNLITYKQKKYLADLFFCSYFDSYYRVLRTSPRSVYLKRAKCSLAKILCYVMRFHYFTIKEFIGIIIFLFNDKLYKILVLKERN